MKVLVADKLPEVAIASLQSNGFDVIDKPEAKDAILTSLLVETQANCLIVRSTKVTGDMLQKSALQLVVRAGAGYNNIDVETASGLGIYVANCPGKNAAAVAELAFGLILSLDRRIPDNVASLRKGQWNKKAFSKAQGLKGRTIGLIGVGNIGREMITRAQAFDMTVIAWSRSLTPEVAQSLQITRMNTIQEVAANCTILSVHLAKTEETTRLINRSVFEKLPPGALFINTSRAEVVDQDALIESVRTRGLRAGLDVFDGEPASGVSEYDGVVRTFPDIYTTHHIGASTEQAQIETSLEAIRIVKSFHVNGHVPNVVNLSARPLASHLLVIRHLDKVGVLADVFTTIKSAGINAQGTRNLVFDGSKAAIAKIEIDGRLTSEHIAALQRNNANIITVNQIPLPA